MTWRERLGWFTTGAYVTVVAGLTAYAFRSPDLEFGRCEAIAAILTLPSIVAALPAIYAVGALAWSVTGARSGDGPMLPVTITFTVMMVGVALANVWVLRQLGRAVWRATRPRRAA